MFFRVIIIMGIFVSFGLNTSAQNLLKNGNFNQGTRNWYPPRCSHFVKDGVFVADIPQGCGPWSILMFQRLKLIPGKKYRLSYKLECEKPGIMRQVYQLSTKPHTFLGLAVNIRATKGEHYYDVIFTARSAVKAHGQLTLNLSKLRGRIKLSDIKIEMVSPVAYNLNPEWTVFTNVKVPKSFAVVPELLNSRKGKKLNLSRPLNLEKLNEGKFTPSKSIAVFFNKFDSSEAGIMTASMSADWYCDLYLNGHCLGSRNGFNNNIDLPVVKGTNILAVVVRNGSRGWSFQCSNPRENIVFNAGKGWKTYQLTSPVIKSGSALDLSVQVDAPAGKYGRTKVSSNGSLVFEDKPEEPQRMLGFNGLPKQIMQEKNTVKFKQLVRDFVSMARRQGYRLFRISFDGYLRKNLNHDKNINSENLDRCDYLISELKKAGIYIHMVVVAYGFYCDDMTEAFSLRDRHKLLMYLDGKWEYEHFRYGAETLFNHVNPYTQTAWKDEPAIAVVEFYNEQSLGIGRLSSIITYHSDIRRSLKKYWRNWLKAKYSKGIPAKVISELNGKTLDSAPLPSAKRGILGNDFALFWMDRAVKSAEKCTKIVRQAGYNGLIAQYSYSKKIGDSAARWNTVSFVNVHSYYNHPSKWTQSGSKIGQQFNSPKCFILESQQFHPVSWTSVFSR